MNQKFGYVRVSSKEQNDERQRVALAAFTIPARNLYCDKQSGKDFHRPAYQRMMKRLRPGDLLVVKSIDRLGRNYEEILEQWKQITKIKGADICIVDMPLLDTRREKDLLGTFISDLVLQILSFVSQTERDYIKQRQSEGIAAAKARGIRFGRPVLNLPDETVAALLEWIDKKRSADETAALLHVTKRTLYNYAKRLNLKSE